MATKPAKISQVRLKKLPKMSLDVGPHEEFAEGHCAMELVAWLTTSKHTDWPECVDPILTEFVQLLNDAMSDAERVRLRPYLPRLVNTRDDGKAQRRLAILRQAPDGTEQWLRQARVSREGLDAAIAAESQHGPTCGLMILIAARTGLNCASASLAVRVVESHVSGMVAYQVYGELLSDSTVDDDWYERFVESVAHDPTYQAYRDIRNENVATMLDVLDQMIEAAPIQ